MHKRAGVTLAALSAWVFLVATTRMGVESAREEATPVEQYNDSGETIRHAGVLIPSSLVLQTLMNKQNINNDEIGENDEEEAVASILKRATHVEGSWNKLHGGWGKRERDWGLTDPEGSKNWNRLVGLVGKRSAKWNDLNGMWGKRGAKDGDWNSLIGGWGKRGWNDMSHGYGKRQSPHWNNLRGMWGRK